MEQGILQYGKENGQKIIAENVGQDIQGCCGAFPQVPVGERTLVLHAALRIRV